MGAALLAALAALFIYLGAHVQIAETDIYWHVLLGTDFLSHARLTGDPSWTFGPSRDWASTEIGFESIAATVSSIAGMKGVAVLTAALVGAAFIALLIGVNLLLPARRRAAAPVVAAIVGLVVLLPSQWYGYLQPRPMAFTVIAYGIFGAVTYRALLTGRAPHPLVMFFGMAAWTFLHGGSLMAMPIFVAILLVRAALRWVGVIPYSPLQSKTGFTALSVLAGLAGTMVNPLGGGIYVNALAIRDTCSELITEWAFPDIETAAYLLPFVLIFAIVSGLAVYRGRRRIVLTNLIYVVVVFLATGTTVRTLITGLVLLAPVLYRPVSSGLLPWSPLPERTWKWAPVALGSSAVAVVVATSALLVPPHTPPAPWTIINGLTATGDDRKVLAPWRYNGMIQWASGPNVATYMDGRADRYGRDQLFDAIVLERSVTPSVLRERLAEPLRRGVTDVVTENPTLATLLISDGWREACRVDRSVWLTMSPVGTCSTDATQPRTRIPERFSAG